MEDWFGTAQLIARRDVSLPRQRMSYWLCWEGLPSGAGAYFIRCLSSGLTGEPEQLALSGDLGDNLELAVAVFQALTDFPPVGPERLQQAAQYLRRAHTQEEARRSRAPETMGRPSYRNLHVISQYHATALLSRLEPV